jgi:FkbM family methyltransferase
MKLKEVFYGLGLRPRPREYPYELTTFHLEEDGDIEFALWDHPSAKRRSEAGKGVRLTQPMVDSIRQFLAPGDVAIDIGAHTGDSSVPIALAVGTEGAVFALEPNIYAFKILLPNAALNKKKANIIPLNFAATPTDGMFDFEYSDPGFCNGGLHQNVGSWKHAHFFKLRVTGKNIPAYLAANYPDEASRVRYVKIDTEGLDRAVAASMRELLVSNRPFIKTEMYKHMPETERRGYFRDLRELGYTMFKVESEESDYRVTPITESNLMNWSHFDVFAAPDGP